MCCRHRRNLYYGGENLKCYYDTVRNPNTDPDPGHKRGELNERKKRSQKNKIIMHTTNKKYVICRKMRKCDFIFIKGTLKRDFRPLVFFIKELPLGL
jgi:hypothetical protein